MISVPIEQGDIYERFEKMFEHEALDVFDVARLFNCRYRTAIHKAVMEGRFPPSDVDVHIFQVLREHASCREVRLIGMRPAWSKNLLLEEIEKQNE